MAEAILGRRLRHPRRRHRPRLPAPRERGGADAGRRAASRWPGSGCTTGCSSSAARRWPSRSATSAALAEVLDDVGPRGAGAVLQRRPLPAADGVLRRARWRRRSGAAARIREAGRRLVAGPVAGGAGAVPRRVLRRAAQRLQHRRGAGRAVRLGARGQPLGGGRRRRAPASRCSTCSACESLLAGPRTRPPEAVELAERRDAARQARDWAEADRLRDELRAHGLGGPRRPRRPRARPGVMSRATPPRPAESRRRAARLASPAAAPEPVGVRRAGRPAGHLRAQPGPRGAARPAARPSGLGDAGGRQEDWRPAKVTIASEREIEERAGSDAHQGVCALVDPYPLRRRGRAARRRRTR